MHVFLNQLNAFFSEPTMQLYLLASAGALAMLYAILRSQDSTRVIVHEDAPKNWVPGQAINWKLVVAGVACTMLGAVGFAELSSLSPIVNTENLDVVATSNNLLMGARNCMMIFVAVGVLALLVGLKSLVRRKG